MQTLHCIINVYINLSPANWTLAWFRPLLMLPPQNAWSTEGMATVSSYRTIWRLQADGARLSSSTSRKHWSPQNSIKCYIDNEALQAKETVLYLRRNHGTWKQVSIPSSWHSCLAIDLQYIHWSLPKWLLTSLAGQTLTQGRESLARETSYQHSYSGSSMKVDCIKGCGTTELHVVAWFPELHQCICIDHWGSNWN